MKKNGKYTYLMLDAHPDQNEAEYIGYAEQAFDNDEDALAYFAKAFRITSETKIARIIAMPRTELVPVGCAKDKDIA